MTMLVFHRANKPSKTVDQNINSSVAISVKLNPLLTMKTDFTPASGPKPATLQDLLALPKTEIAKVDILRMNLLCATGLPGSEDINITRLEATLDQWAKVVAERTDSLYYKFVENPAKFDSSEAYFRALVLVWTLQTQFKVHYNPAFVTTPDKLPPEKVFFADSKNVFLNGLIDPRAMGTCGSMPALYVAVGRRLGYPMKFVLTYDHGFARWESPDGKERFNIEATDIGMNRHPDDFYKNWPRAITDKMIQARHYLQSLTPLEELAVFLQTRVTCLKVSNRLPEAHEAALQAQYLTPDWEQNKIFLAQLDRLMHPVTQYFPLQQHPEDSYTDVVAFNRANQQRIEAYRQHLVTSQDATPTSPPTPTANPGIPVPYPGQPAPLPPEFPSSIPGQIYPQPAPANPYPYNPIPSYP